MKANVIVFSNKNDGNAENPQKTSFISDIFARSQHTLPGASVLHHSEVITQLHNPFPSRQPQCMIYDISFNLNRTEPARSSLCSCMFFAKALHHISISLSTGSPENWAITSGDAYLSLSQNGKQS